MPDTTPTPLALFLAEHDVPCPNPRCGFNLRGLKDPTCPECKEPLSLTVRRPETLWQMRRWVLAAATCMALSTIVSAASWLLSLFAGPGTVWMTWESYLYLGMTFVLAITWPAIIIIYFRSARRGSPRAVPRLLRSLVITLCLSYSIYTLLGLWRFAKQILIGEP